jgi:RNA polymerase sigma factor (sigma-70 family)
MSTEMYNEIELIKASRHGDTAAFETIVKNYQSFICAITYCATGDIGKSEELAQETFLAAWKDLAQLKDLNKFRSWISSITRNIIRNSFRHQKRDLISKAVSIDHVEDLETSGSEPTEKAITAEQKAVVRQALEQIPLKYREPLVLFYRQEQSVKQVAGQLELSEQAVKQRLSRGRNMLKEQVEAIAETTIRNTGPGTVFTAAVVAALPAIMPQAASAAIAATAAKGSGAAKFASALSWISGILAPLFALVGIIVAIRPEIKNMSKRERKESLRNNLIVLSATTAFIIFILSFAILWCKYVGHSGWIMFTISCVLLAILVLVLIPFMIRSMRREKQIQIEDGTYVKPHVRMLRATNGQIYGAFGGAIFASLLWLIRISSATKDWMVFCVILTFAILVFTTATKLYMKARWHGLRIAIGLFTSIGFLHFLLVNLRWKKWQAVLKNFRPTLGQVNMTIAAAVAVLILVALIIDWRQQKMRKINSFKTDDQFFE